jgi:alginate O-acetyltransferase complex protein AlgI
MIFTSWAFLRFFVIVLAGLALMPSRRTRQLLILLASAYFYSYWNPSYLLLLAAPSIVDYLCALKIEDGGSSSVRKTWLVVSLVTNLGLLAYFKYTNFFIDNIAGLTGLPLRHLSILLPVGISFFTFKTLSYTIDVYRTEIKACRQLWRYAMFVSYFPELVAGPIVRASVFLPQMGRSLKPSWPRAFIGLQVVLLGVTKKIVIADRLAIFADRVFLQPAAYSSLTVTLAVIAYSIQIYCDFSGYSDIAIGISKIIGFDLPENFNMPYLATSVTEFWHRWHITLSQWLRDYLYIPLGGNRRGPVRTYVNLFITMLLGGLWHGANWTFVFWGFLHGLALAAHKFWTGRQRKPGGILSICMRWVATYAFICLTWIFFRSQNFSTAMTVIQRILSPGSGGIVWMYTPLFLLLPLVILGHFIGAVAARQSMAVPSKPKRIVPPKWAAALYAGNHDCFALKPHKRAGIYVLLPLPGFAGGFALTVWLAIVYLFASIDTSPFIYFQF